jgi:prolyl 4-hydroxylase
MSSLLGMAPYDDDMTDGLQVLRYNTSKAYIPHVDYLEDNGSGHDYDSSGQGSNRFATIFFYLSDVEEGGETVTLSLSEPYTAKLKS